MKTLLQLAREQGWPLPLAPAIGIATGILLELQSSALQPIRRPGEAGFRIAPDTVWIGLDGRVWLERRRAALAGEGTSSPALPESGLPAVAAVLLALAKDTLKTAGALPPRQIRTLEIILRRALSVEDARRYLDAGEMQADLEAFASEAGLDTSPRSRAQLLRERLQERSLESASHLCEWPTPADARDSAPTLVSAPRLTAAPDERDDLPTAKMRSPDNGPVMGILVKGRLDERLDSAGLGVVPGARVVVDFASADRFTEAGLDAWTTLMRAVSSCPRAALWLARVPESFVQRAMQVPTLLEGAHIVSFVAPLACGVCGRCFGRVIDVERDRADIDCGRAEGTCPRCRSRAKLDEEPRYLAFAAMHAGIAVPAEVRAEIERLDAESQDARAVERYTTLAETQLFVRGPVDGSVRWDRALAGTVGQLRIDFHPTTELAREAVDQLLGLLRAPPPEISSCVLVDPPAGVMIALGPSLKAHLATGWLRVESLHLHGHCRACNVIRGSTVSWEEAQAAWRTEGAASLHCLRCRGPLECGEDDPLRCALLPSIVPPSFPGLAVVEPRRARRWVPAIVVTVAALLVLALVTALGIAVGPRVPLHDGVHHLVARGAAERPAMK